MSERLAFCSWSVQPDGPEDLIRIARSLEINRVQLSLNPLVEDEAWIDAGKRLKDAGVRAVSGMFAPIGEDYSTLATIRETGGVVPDEYWDANLALFMRVADAAKDLSVKTITFHAGFIPEPEAPAFGKLVTRLNELARVLQDATGGDLLLETGQETAQALNRLMDEVDREDIGVNFDPANMILYGMGDPVEAAGLLLKHIRQVHIKDATASQAVGQWGAEVPVGLGEVDWHRFLSVIHAQGYTGDLVIEREAGDDRAADIRRARDLIIQQMPGAVGASSVDRP